MIKRDEADRARAGRADSVAENSFEDQRDDDRAPTDEDRRGIEIGDGRTFLQIHPRDETEGVDGEREQQQIKCGAIQRAAPTQPRSAREEKCQNVQNHAVGERIDMVEKKLERCAFRCGRLLFCHPTAREDRHAD